jgi:hypothetical protein
MDVHKILAELRQEHAQIEEVIASLEVLALTRQRRRGRPPAILVAARERARGQSRTSHVKDGKPATAPAPRVLAAGQSPHETA